MKGVKLLITILVVCIFSIITILLINNKTFLTNIYEGSGNYKIFIPKYSYFKEECCNFEAKFYSLKSKKNLDNEINNYLDQFEFYEDIDNYGYKKDDLIIHSYEVDDKGLYRTISILYDYLSEASIEE